MSPGVIPQDTPVVDRSARPSAPVGHAGEVDDRPMATGGRPSLASSMENRAQADHPAGAAIPPLLSSTGGSGLSFQMTRPSRDPNVDEDGHQVRERSIPCRGCRRRTWAYDAECEACR
jgi:hypothetical protein